MAVLGIGSAINGDDAAGVQAAHDLGPLLTGRDHLLVLDTGLAPENHTGPVRRFAPDLVLLVDAAQMDDAPGTVRWLDWRDTDGMSASTHTLPPYLLAEYLVGAVGCDVALIGIQPADNTPGDPLSAPVRAAVRAVVDGLAALLG